MTKAQLIDLYAAQGSDIVNDVEFRAEVRGGLEFTLEMVKGGLIDGVLDINFNEGVQALTEMIEIIDSL